MASPRALLARVAALERARVTPRSPFEAAYGSFGAFATDTQTGIVSGQFDSRDMPVVLNCIRRWHDEGVWGLWRRDRIWEIAL